MARSKYSSQKRSRELARKQKNQDKISRKQEARKRKEESRPSLNGVDSDITGIVPGPQPLPEQWNDERERDESPAEEAEDKEQ
jgi:hypothetical protein